MEYLTNALIILGLLTLVNIICTIVLYPELKVIAAEFTKEY